MTATKTSVQKKTIPDGLLRQLQQLAAGDESPRGCRNRLQRAGALIDRIAAEQLPPGDPYDVLRCQVHVTRGRKSYDHPVMLFAVDMVRWAQDSLPGEVTFLARKYGNFLYIHHLISGRDPEFLRVNIPAVVEIFSSHAVSS